MNLWRLCSGRFAASAFSGEGARLYGGRWNSRGQRMVYCADSLPLAMLETLVHVDSDQLPKDYVSIQAGLPDGCAIEELGPEKLPHGWSSYPAPTATQLLGDAWLRKNEAVALVVPSVVSPTNRCILLNPAHPDFAKLSIANPEPFAFDNRLRKAP